MSTVYFNRVVNDVIDTRRNETATYTCQKCGEQFDVLLKWQVGNSVVKLAGTRNRKYCRICAKQPGSNNNSRSADYNKGGD